MPYVLDMEHLDAGFLRAGLGEEALLAEAVDMRSP